MCFASRQETIHLAVISEICSFRSGALVDARTFGRLTSTHFDTRRNDEAHVHANNDALPCRSTRYNTNTCNRLHETCIRRRVHTSLFCDLYFSYSRHIQLGEFLDQSCDVITRWKLCSFSLQWDCRRGGRGGRGGVAVRAESSICRY